MVCVLLKWKGELMKFAWEMGCKLGLWWHMLNQMGNGKDEI